MGANFIFHLAGETLSQEQFICKSDLRYMASTTPQPLLPVGVQILLPSHPLTCSGRVTKWGVLAKGEGGHNVEFQIWRPMEVDESNHLPTTYEKVGWHSHYIEPLEERTNYVQVSRNALTFKQGDMIGLYLENNLSIENDFQVPYQENSTGSMILYKMAAKPHDVLERRELTNELLGAVPFVRVVMETGERLKYLEQPSLQKK